MPATPPSPIRGCSRPAAKHGLSSGGLGVPAPISGFSPVASARDSGGISGFSPVASARDSGGGAQGPTPGIISPEEALHGVASIRSTGSNSSRLSEGKLGLVDEHLVDQILGSAELLPSPASGGSQPRHGSLGSAGGSSGGSGR